MTIQWQCNDNTMTIQWPKEKGQKSKRRSTKHHIENKRLSNMNPTKKHGWTQVARWCKQFLLHMWRPSFYTRYKPSDKSGMVVITANGYLWPFVTHILDNISLGVIYCNLLVLFMWSLEFARALCCVSLGNIGWERKHKLELNVSIH